MVDFSFAYLPGSLLGVCDAVKGVGILRIQLEGMDQLKVKDASWVYQPGEISNVRAFPFWKVTVGDQDYFVDQSGKLHDHIAPTKGGS